MILRLPVLLLVAAGMVAGDLISAAEPAPIIGVAALVAAFMLLVIASAPWRDYRIATALVLLSFGYACSIAAGLYFPRFPPDNVANLSLPAKAEVVGELLADSEQRADTQRLLLEVEAIDAGGGTLAASGRVLVYVRKPSRMWSAGDRVRAPVALRRPRNFGNPGEFDYRGYLARRGVHVTGFAFDDTEFELLAASPGGLATAIGRWRRALRDHFVQVLPGETGGVLRALILGETGALPEDLQQAFGRSGVRHVLSVSGLHVSMVAAASYSLIRWLLGRSRWLLLATNVPKVAVAFSIVPVLVYAQLAGSEVATMRSVVMGLVFLGAVVVDRRRHLLVSLAAAAVILIATGPGTSREISFQLSFAAVLGLIVVLERFWPWWLRLEEEHLMRLRGWRGRLWRSVALYFAVSIAALAATTPLGAFYFNQVSVIALLANAVVVPLLGSIAVALGLIASLLYWILPSLASLLVWSAGVFIDIGIMAVRLFAAIPFAAFTIVTPTKIELALLYAAMFAAVCLGGRRRPTVLAAVAFLLLIDLGWWWRDRLHGEELRVTFLSVGQGDSAVVEFPGGAVLVVDGGGLMSPTFDVGERILAPYLWSRRISAIDYLAVTHPQWDHYGGFEFLAEHFAPRRLWSADTSPTSASYLRLLERLQLSGTGFQTLQARDVLRIGGVDVTVVAPAASAAGLSVNDRSLVLSMSYGGRRVLLAGDIEAAAERLLVRESGADLRSAVLKVPHHGSSTSSTAEFIAAVRPEVAVVSAGFDNRYGFPARRVIGRYAGASSQVLRTDLDGAVEVRIRASGESWVRAGQRGSWSELEPIAAD